MLPLYDDLHYNEGDLKKFCEDQSTPILGLHHHDAIHSVIIYRDTKQVPVVIQYSLFCVECDDGYYELSNCCGGGFGEPGFPDNDICSTCGEHSEPDICEACEGTGVYKVHIKLPKSLQEFYYQSLKKKKKDV